MRSCYLACTVFLALILVACSQAQSNNTAANFPRPKSSSLCRDSQHVLGRWRLGSKTKKTYFVCSWDQHENMYYPSICGYQSRNHENLVYGHAQWLMQSGGHSSMCDKRDNTRDIVTKREQYVWEPLLCDLIPWNATQFCELLGSRIILMIGDSTMQQTAAALMTRITTDAEKMKGCSPQLWFGRSDMFRHSAVKPQGYIDSVKPDIVIMSNGPHFNGNITEFELDQAYMEAMVKEVRATATKKITFVWKTVNPGHVNCSETSGGPLSTEFYSHHADPADEFDYRIFPEQDRVAKRVAHRLGMKIIDMSPLYYRQDAHSDCLHYCLPGPIDLFSELLLNMLYNDDL